MTRTQYMREPRFYENSLYAKLYDFYFRIITKPQKKHIFVLGNQKSGTTVIGECLARAAGMSVLSDIPARNKTDFDNFVTKKKPLAKFISKYPHFFNRQIVKEPTLTFFMDELIGLYPDSKYAIIVRDPRDNIRSILNRLNLPGNKKKISNEELSTMNPFWRYIIEGIYGCQGDNYIENLAKRWVLGIEEYNRYKHIFVLLRYEDFIKDKTSSIKELAQKLGLSEKHGISSVMNRQFQPKGDSEISWNDFFGKSNIRRIENICKRHMEQLNY